MMTHVLGCGHSQTRREINGSYQTYREAGSYVSMPSSTESCFLRGRMRDTCLGACAVVSSCDGKMVLLCVICVSRMRSKISVESLASTLCACSSSSFVSPVKCSLPVKALYIFLLLVFMLVVLGNPV